MIPTLIYIYVRLSCHTIKPTRKGKKLINNISSSNCKNKILHPNVLPCPIISDQDAPYIIVNIPTNKYEIHYKFIRNLKHFNLETYINNFKAWPFAVVYSFNKTDDQLDILNKLIFSVIDKHAPPVKTKFTRPPHSGWNALKSISYNPNEIIGDMKCVWYRYYCTAVFYYIVF